VLLNPRSVFYTTPTPMRYHIFCTLLIGTLGVAAMENDVLPSIQPMISQVTQEFDQIPVERQVVLKKTALYIRTQVQAKEVTQLTFICTHNSRRSHLSQIWAQTAAAYYDLPAVKTFSGGTEVTACNERTVAALKRAGFDINNSTPDQKNPVYLVRYGPNAEPLRAFSKVYSSEGNPTSNFVALMTCDTADKNCPLVKGSVLRVAVPYVDPKVSDGSEKEVATYDERSRQIAREMFFLMSQARGEGS
jgi:arsenate reductase (thioredoxin)